MAKAKSESHNSLVQAILDYLKLKKCFAWRINSGIIKKGNYVIRLAPAGCSDVIGFTPDGKFLAVEAKRKPDKPTAAQLKFLHEVRTRNGFACVVYEIEELFDEWKSYASKTAK